MGITDKAPTHSHTRIAPSCCCGTQHGNFIPASYRAIQRRPRAGSGTVIITARSSREEETSSHFIQADISTQQGVARVIREVLERFKGIDIIVHNVGGSSAPGGGFLTVTDDLWQQAIDENLFPAVRLDRGFLPSMIARGSGVIIHISSIQRRLPLYESVQRWEFWWKFLPRLTRCAPLAVQSWCLFHFISPLGCRF